MNERVYSEALYQAVAGGLKLDAALLRLKEILKERGHTALYGKLLKRAEARFEKEAGAGTLEITVARKGDEKIYTEEIAKIKKDLNVTHTTVRIDETITGGYIARTQSQEIDASHKKSLLSIYRQLIA